MHTITIPFVFTVSSEQGDALLWTAPSYPYAIYATPYYDNTRGISVDITANNGEVFTSFIIPYIGHEAIWTHEAPG